MLAAPSETAIASFLALTGPESGSNLLMAELRREPGGREGRLRSRDVDPAEEGTLLADALGLFLANHAVPPLGEYSVPGS